MQSKAPDVATYMAELAGDRRQALEKLRKLCRQLLTGYTECMEYGMPAYKRDGVAQVAFASQKQYISLYVLQPDVMERYRQELTGCRIGKGCIRFSRADRINFDQIRALLQDAADSKSRPC